ncbi:MAG TPA: hypothetical protein VF175_12870 [Lacipirellula sp.]
MEWDKIEVLMIAAATYVAIVSLVRLMAARRDQVIKHLRSEFEKQRKAKEAAEQIEQDAA